MSLFVGQFGTDMSLSVIAFQSMAYRVIDVLLMRTYFEIVGPVVQFVPILMIDLQNRIPIRQKSAGNKTMNQKMSGPVFDA